METLQVAFVGLAYFGMIVCASAAGTFIANGAPRKWTAWALLAGFLALCGIVAGVAIQ